MNSRTMKIYGFCSILMVLAVWAVGGWSYAGPSGDGPNVPVISGDNGTAARIMSPRSANENDNKNKTDMVPDLAVDAYQIDLDRVQEGDPLFACFELRNQGHGTLIIQRVKAGCTCTQVDYPNEIQPGQAISVCITIDTMGIHGRRKFKTAIYTNDPVHPDIVLRVQADIAPLLTLTSDRVFFKDGTPSAQCKEIIIENKGADLRMITLSPHELTDKFTAQLTQLVKGKRWRLSVRNIAPAPADYRGRLILHSDHPGRETIAIPVFTHLPAAVAVYPSTLTLSTGRCPKCKAQGIFTGELLVRSHDDSRLNIRSLTPRGDTADQTTADSETINKAGGTTNCETTITPLAKGRAHRVTVRYHQSDDNLPPDHIVIETDREGYERIRVPVMVGDR